MPTWEQVKEYASRGFTIAIEAAFEYDTPKIVHIKNKKVGLLNRLVQLGIIGYVVGYAIIYQKGYQDTEEVVSAVTTKVQGLGYTDGIGVYENAGDRVWDSSDFVIPPQSPNSVFIMTNMWITNQTQGICHDISANCTTDDDCIAGTVTKNGVLNGTCDASNSSCWARSWCPEEVEDKNITTNSSAVPKLSEAVNFTILIKNTIQFPRLSPHFRRRNLLDRGDQFKHCRFDFSTNFFCPIFRLQTIIDMLETKYTFDQLAVNGSVLGLQIEWDCNLDRSASHCMPRYSARRLDDPHATLTPGFSFRYANEWMGPNGTLTRQLTKAYGIRINILVSGMGGKFSASALILKLGSGIALLAVATVVSDIVVLYVLRERAYYRKKKYLNVVADATIFSTDGSKGQSDRKLSPAGMTGSVSETDDEKSLITNGSGTYES